MKKILIQTTREKQAIDITSKITPSIRNGIITIQSLHTTCCLFVNEFEPNIACDYEKLFSLLDSHDWKHEHVDKNAHAHLFSALTGHSITIIVQYGKLVLGTWQRIILMELDGPRKRTIAIQEISKL